MYCSVWFIIFNKGPASWFENHYFEINDPISKSQPASEKQEPSQHIDFVEQNISVALIILGIFCIFVAYLLFVSMQLVKRILRRMERLNSVIYIQSLHLLLLASALALFVEISLNFEGPNSASTLLKDMP
jgi:H+/Cl- antiporter ClcA